MKTNAYEVILRPIITEKSMLGIENKTYTFEVAKGTNKTHIKLAIEELYGVNVEAVRVINAKPRPRRVGRHSGYKSGFRKAIIKLKADSKEIASFEM